MPQTWQKFRKHELIKIIYCMEKVNSEEVMKIIFPEISFIDKLQLQKFEISRLPTPDI